MRKVIKLVSPWILLALLAAGCGGSDRSSSSNDSQSAPPSSQSSNNDSSEDNNQPEDEDDASSAESADDPIEESTPEPALPTFGDIDWPCGPGSASGATDQGVTDSEILIGGGDDRGFVGSLGLNVTQTDTIQAFVDVCNDMGGILGREIVVELYDAKIFEVSKMES